jgi:hypothetical protein
MMKTLTYEEAMAAAERAAVYPPGYGGVWGCAGGLVDGALSRVHRAIMDKPELAQYG